MIDMTTRTKRIVSGLYGGLSPREVERELILHRRKLTRREYREMKNALERKPTTQTERRWKE